MCREENREFSCSTVKHISERSSDSEWTGLISPRTIIIASGVGSILLLWEVRKGIWADKNKTIITALANPEYANSGEKIFES